MRVPNSVLKRILTLVFSGIILTSCFNPIIHGNYDLNGFLNSQENFDEVIEETPKSSSTTNNIQLINEIFSKKISDFNTLGYFPQVYEPSLQATYYALSTLDTIGRLDSINTTAVLEFILSKYNVETNIFMDTYAYRYLDSIIWSDINYPLNSVLEINCYAILSLIILNQLDQVDKQQAIEFIWSCYNPEGNVNGFIGLPYDASLDQKWKTASIDNTYYAVITLNQLMPDWTAYSSEKNKIIQFVNYLQTDGFRNDLNNSIYTLDMVEPNMFSSFYSLKTLEIFNLVDTISKPDFNDFLSDRHQVPRDYFRIAYFATLLNLSNVVASSIALELSDLTGFTNFNRENTIHFILDHRTSNGGWRGTSSDEGYELIDTFQIIRSLLNCGELDRLSASDFNEISKFIELYLQYNGGYSLVSNDYVAIDHFHAIASSFEIYDRISDLNIGNFYNLLMQAYRSYSDIGFEDFFRSYASFDEILCSKPLEFQKYGKLEYIDELTFLSGNKILFKALDTMKKTYKLNDFYNQNGFDNFLQRILDSQFLESGYETNGAFLPFSRRTYPPEYLNTCITFEFSYYAIKTMEIISNFLSLGPITSLPFNKGALFDYINRNIKNTNTTLYFDPSFTSSPEIQLEYTYYMIYILKSLDLYNLNNQKIIQFVIENIDYSNIKNIYFSYKISDILDISIDIDYQLTQSLINQLYSNEMNEFYISTDFQEIDHEIFYWICEMAVNSELAITYNYLDSTLLGEIIPITTSFENLVCDDFGSGVSVILQNDYFGNLEFERQVNNIYQYHLLVPESPECFPNIEGILKIYKDSRIMGESPIYIGTTIEHIVNDDIHHDDENYYIQLNISRKFCSGYKNLSKSSLVLNVLQEGALIDSLLFNNEEFPSFTRFYLTYPYSQTKEFLFNITLFDEYFPMGYNILSKIQEIPEKLIISGPILALSAAGLSIGSVLGVSKVKGIVSNKIRATRPKRLKEEEIPENAAAEINNAIKKDAFFNS